MNRNDIIIVFYTVLLLLFFISLGLGYPFSYFGEITVENPLPFFTSIYYLIILMVFALVLPKEGKIFKANIVFVLKLLAPITVIIVLITRLSTNFNIIDLIVLLGSIGGLLGIILEKYWSEIK